MINLGIMRRKLNVRIAGLALLGIPVLKLFIVDTFTLDMGYRVGAYLSLGILLMVMGFLYQRYRDHIRGFLLEAQ